jgi:hypothetical protein
MRAVLGVDPGLTGGAVLICGRDVLGAWSWREVTRRKERAWVLDGAWVPMHPDIPPPEIIACECATLAQVARTIEGTAHVAARYWDLAVEGLFVGAHANGLISLAESAGVMIGCLSEGHVTRRSASEWRMMVGCPTRPADLAEREAIRISPMRLAWPDGRLWRELRERGHVAEASLIALDAQIMRDSPIVAASKGRKR